MGEIELRESVKWFAEQMELVLRKNDHKGGWKNCTWEYLFDRLEEEQKELVEECYKDGYSDVFDIFLNTNTEAMIKEAVDVANFAMMIADNLRENPQPKGDGE